MKGWGDQQMHCPGDLMKEISPEVWDKKLWREERFPVSGKTGPEEGEEVSEGWNEESRNFYSSKGN